MGGYSSPPHWMLAHGKTPFLRAYATNAAAIGFCHSDRLRDTHPDQPNGSKEGDMAAPFFSSRLHFSVFC